MATYGLKIIWNFLQVLGVSSRETNSEDEPFILVVKNVSWYILAHFSVPYGLPTSLLTSSRLAKATLGRLGPYHNTHSCLLCNTNQVWTNSGTVLSQIK